VSGAGSLVGRLAHGALLTLVSAALALQLGAAAEALSLGLTPALSLGAWLSLTLPLAALVTALRLCVGALGRAWSRDDEARLASLIAAGLVGLAALSASMREALTWLEQRSEAAWLLPHAAALLVGALSPLLIGLILGLRAALQAPLKRLSKRMSALSVALIGSTALWLSSAPSARLILVDQALLAPSLLGLSLLLALKLRAHLKLGPWVALMLLVGSSALAYTSLLSLARSPQSLTALSQARAISPLPLSLLWRLSDRDGDGYSAWLGGGDCDDSAPEVNPEALDLPSNGVDEDCDGADASLDEQPQAERLSHDTSARLHSRQALHSPPSGGPWNLLFITIDALRADHVGWAGYHRPTTPQLDPLARAGLVFERAYTPCADTRYSVPPLMSGLPLPELSLDWRGRYLVMTPPAAPSRATLFERLRAVGYASVGVTGELLTEGMWYGLERGFDQLIGDPQVQLRRRSSARLTELVTQQLKAWERRSDERPWALWAHYIDPHEPYLKRADYPFGERPLDRYDAEIAATDAQIGRLLATLKALGERERTLIVISADHGEEFGEHGRRFHGKQLFDESVRVPLLIHVPGAASVSVPEPVSTLDLVETLAELMGLAPGPRSARSHAQRLSGGPAPRQEPVITYRVHNQKPQLLGLSIASGEHKLLYHGQRGLTQLYSVTDGESSELSEREPALYRKLSSLARAEARRFKSGLFKQLYERHVTPLSAAQQRSSLTSSRPLGRGLQLVALKAERVRVGQRTLKQLKAQVLVTAQPEAGLRFKARWSGREGLKPKVIPIEALGGLYPPTRWRAGELVELISAERIPDELSLRAELIIEQRGTKPLIIAAEP